MHRAGFINIIGNPNVGKSTLMNNLVGEKLSIITSKAQTTRHRILGIVNGDNFQLIISDTPGIIKPSYELQSSMMDFVKSALEDADVLVYMLEIGEKSIRDIEVHNKINNAKVPVIILLNKIDLSDQQQIETEIDNWSKMYPNSDIVAVSNSKDQKDFILKRCKQKNIKNIKVITADMNDFKIETTFDRIVSICLLYTSPSPRDS